MEFKYLKNTSRTATMAFVFCLMLSLLLGVGMNGNMKDNLKDISKTMAQTPEESGIGELSAFQDPAGAFQDHMLKPSSLLLGSHVTECQTATVRYVVWMGKIGMNQDLLRGLESLYNGSDGFGGFRGFLGSSNGSDGSWNVEILANGWGERAVCLWSQERINVEEERKVPEKLKQLEERVCQLGWDQNDAVIYLEESVDEAIDFQAYWGKKDIVICQKSNDGSVESWSGFDPKGLKPSLCGTQKINIQLTTRQTGGGKTVLAFPALYNDI